MSDKLDKVFLKQNEFMSMLREYDKLPEYPVDLTTKPGQRLIKEMMWNLSEELAEASYTLKNRVHKLSDDTEVDYAHYKEELLDAFAYLVEICILSGISANEFYEEYSRKNAIVKKRLEEGY